MENTVTCAPEYDQLIVRTDVRRQPNGTPVLTSQEVDLLRELQQVFEKIDHDQYSNPCVWITIPRGPIESWETWEEAQEYDEIKTRDEYEDLWKYYYPDVICWYRCAFSTTEEGYMAFLVNNGRDTAFLRFDPREDKVYENVESYYEVYLRYSLDRVKETVRRLEEGTYNVVSPVEEKLPDIINISDTDFPYAYTSQEKAADWEKEIGVLKTIRTHTVNPFDVCKKSLTFILHQ